MKKKLFGLLCAAMVLTMASGTAYASEAETADASTEIQLGTNQNDAVLVPLDTKLYGTVSSGYYWFSFTTSSNTEADYQMTMVNKSTTTSYVRAKIFDEYGTQYSTADANKDGLAVTFSLGELEALTTYYVQISTHNGNDATFMVIIRDFNELTTGIQTSDNIVAEDGTVIEATNQDDAGLIPTNSRVEASTTGGYRYFAFTAETLGEYSITVVNETPTTSYVRAKVFDEYGTQLASGDANKDGLAVTISIGELSEGTTYYIQISTHNSNEADFSITIRAPETEETETVIIGESYEETEAEELIFTVPFEINSTQVQFVINSDEFIDEEAAKTAVEPVAEALLSHPDNAILIAGTTATDGTQESCVDLSNRRAEAVKNLLVNEFGVPESQIQTIGLGYEADPFERGQDREVEGDITSAFIESEAKKNRRVVIMDLASDIAQQILADNA